MGKVLIGISSWADRGLIESGFYPEAVRTPAERLEYYSREFPVAEIDASYHYFTTGHNLELWLENTPPGFRFDIKAFSLFTGHPTSFESLPRSVREANKELAGHRGNLYPHHLPAEATDELWRIFARTAQTMESAGKLGAVLFQFPPWFHPGQESFKTLAECRRRLPQFRLAVEFRAASWLGEESRKTTLDFMREHELTLVCVDEPQGFRSSMPPAAEVTGPLGFIRFHGRNAENWERSGIDAEGKFRYLYSEQELAEWVPRVRLMADSTAELHVIFKNKYADFPVRNARTFRRMLG